MTIEDALLALLRAEPAGLPCRTAAATVRRGGEYVRTRLCYLKTQGLAGKYPALGPHVVWFAAEHAEHAVATWVKTHREACRLARKERNARTNPLRQRQRRRRPRPEYAPCNSVFAWARRHEISPQDNIVATNETAPRP